MKGNDEKKVEKEYRKKVIKYDKILGNGGTYGKALDDLGKKLYKNCWGGVWTQADLPWKKIKNKNRLYIIFNNDYEGPGDHWLGMYVYHEQVYIWDSYGREPSEIVPVLKSKLESMKIRYQHNDKDANQTIKQKNCGSRCFAWLECIDEFGTRRAMKI